MIDLVLYSNARTSLCIRLFS